MLYCNTYRKRETAQRLIYSLFSRIAILKKATSKRTLFCFGAPSNTLEEDLNTFYCCLRHKFSTKAFLCKTKYFYIVDSDVELNKTHIMHYCVSPETTVTRTRPVVTLRVHCLFCYNPGPLCFLRCTNCVYACMYMYVCMRVCMYVRICVYVWMYVCMYMYICIYTECAKKIYTF